MKRTEWIRSRRSLLVLVLLAWIACGGDSTGPGDQVSSIEIGPDVLLIVGIGKQAVLTTDVRDYSGGVLSSSLLEWSVEPASLATVDGATRRVTALSEGVGQVVARAGSARATLSLEVYVDPNQAPFFPATQYFGRNDYVEYEPGELPLILSAPHGGYLNPAEIPERTFGVTGQDLRTQELTRALADAIEARSGRRPHVIISLLHRRRLDPNREIVEAAQGSPFAEQAWAEFQGFIDVASETVEAGFGDGLYIDMHGHGHDIQRLELGYLLTSDELSLSDVLLGQQDVVDGSSLRSLAGVVPITFAELVRGPSSLGGLLEAAGYPAVPAPGDRQPGSAPFFNGGYNTARHGSRDGGTVDGIQIEHHYGGVRDTEQARAAYAAVLAEALETYLLTHYGYDWTAGGGEE